jgi:hypothetical protein
MSDGFWHDHPKMDMAGASRESNGMAVRSVAVRPADDHLGPPTQMGIFHLSGNLPESLVG